MLREFEENNKHGFDNRGGVAHVTGIYRWVDKIYTNRLMNYGKRLLLSFSVPEPAKWYKKAMLWKPKTAEGTTPETTDPKKPKTLVELLINREGKIVKRLISERSRFIERRVYH